MQKDTIRTYFSKLGLEAEIADIYLALHAYGPQTIAALARNSKVERTRIYRLIDKLTESNLIEAEMLDKRAVIKAAPVANLRILINQREEELRNLQDELQLIEQTLARNSLSDAASRVQMYGSPDSLRQMLRNELEAKSGIIGFSYHVLEEAVDKKFLQEWNIEFAARKLQKRLLIADDFMDSWAESNKPAQAKGVDYRTADPKMLRINFSCSVYDGVVAYYHWKDGAVYGTEVHNQDLAESQRQLLEALWMQSAPASALA